jgi:hypothetical protein
MSLREWHGFQNSVRWRLTPEGVEVEGTGVERSKGRPSTVTKVWDAYGAEINRTAQRRQVPCALIIATICTESGGNAEAVRLEPGYVSDEETPHRVSVGLTQTLISTAREAMQMSFGRDWLVSPGNAIEAGTAYIAKQARVTRLDPPLVAAAYNAGRLAHQDGERNRWKLRQYPIGTSKHCDRFVAFFNDALAVLASHETAPSVGIDGLLDGEQTVRPVAPRASRSVSVRFGTNAKPDSVTPYSLSVLEDVLATAGLRKALISSTSRDPADQARVMYDNLEQHGADHQRKLYARGGRMVIDEYVRCKGEGMSASQIRANMERRIREIGPTRVSRHASDPQVLNVFDVAPSSIHDRDAFEAAARADRRIAYFLVPPKDPGYHLEIPQPTA